MNILLILVLISATNAKHRKTRRGNGRNCCDRIEELETQIDQLQSQLDAFVESTNNIIKELTKNLNGGGTNIPYDDTALMNMINDINDDIDTLNDTQNDLQTGFVLLTDTQNGLISDVSTLTATQNGIISDVDGLIISTDILEANVSSLFAAQNELQSQMDQIIEDQSNNNGDESLQNQIDTIDGRLRDPVDIRQPYQTINYIIALQGTFPTPNRRLLLTNPGVGEIRLFAGNFEPAGFAFCNGQLLQISSNNALFSLLGTTYGGDGSTTFGLPDLRGRVSIHHGGSVGPGLSSYTLGEQGGAETVTL